MENLQQPIQMQLSKQEKTFSEFLAAFSKPESKFEQFKRKVTVIAYVFSKLWTAKDMTR